MWAPHQTLNPTPSQHAAQHPAWVVVGCSEDPSREATWTGLPSLLSIRFCLFCNYFKTCTLASTFTVSLQPFPSVLPPNVHRSGVLQHRVKLQHDAALSEVMAVWTLAL